MCAILLGMHTTNPDFLSTAEVAKMLDTTSSTISRWVAQGRLQPAVRGPGLRGAFLFSRADVEQLQESHR